MKQSTIIERKRFAADLAERDARSLVRDTTGKGGGSTTVECVPSGKPDKAPRKAARTSYARRGRPPVVADERMRRWWLARFTLDEIRELGECLR